MKKVKSSLILLIMMLILPAVIYAVFFDKESTDSNTFSAATLDIQYITSDSTEFSLEQNTSVSVNTQLINTGSLENTNTLKFYFKNGEWNLASKINLTVSGDTTFSGKLADLSLTGIPLNISETKNISLSFSISNEDAITYQGQSVTFKITDMATQIGSVYPNGFYDSEGITFTISIPAQQPLPSLTQSNNSLIIDSTEIVTEEQNLLPEDINNLTPQENIENEETI